MNNTSLGRLVTPMGRGLRSARPVSSSSLPVRSSQPQRIPERRPRGGLSSFAHGGMIEISRDDLRRMVPQNAVPDYLQSFFAGGGAVRAALGAMSPLLGIPSWALASAGMQAKDAIRDDAELGSLGDLVQGFVDPSRDAMIEAYSRDTDPQWIEPDRPHTPYSWARRMGAALHPYNLSGGVMLMPDPITSLRGKLKRLADERAFERANTSVFDIPSDLPAEMNQGNLRRMGPGFACGGLNRLMNGGR